ncbi:MAG: hypothetical protein EBU33_01575 [Sphingobacteriia bacterium]|nr:hypothetical protein [Sphingobacteriia bacterium]
MIIFTNSQSKVKLTGGNDVVARSNGMDILSTSDGPILQQKTKGNLLLRAPSQKTWQHPWETTVQWYTKESGVLKNTKEEAIEGFAALVHPGFVNGIDPVVEGACPVNYVEDEGQSEIGLGARAIKKQKTSKMQPGLLDCPLVPLYEIQAVPATKYVPGILQKMGGVGSNMGSMSLSGNAMKGNFSLNINNDLTGNRRYVHSTDIFLATARPTKRLDVDTSTLNLVTGAGVSYNITYDMTTLQQYGVRSRLLTGKFDIGPTNEEEQAIAAEKGDSGLDFLPIATVYFLSPKGVEAPVDYAWTPFVQHHAFWNFGYNFKLQNPVNFAGMDLYPRGLTTFQMAVLGMSRAMDAIAAKNSAENEIMAKAFAGVKALGRYYTQ